MKLPKIFPPKSIMNRTKCKKGDGCGALCCYLDIGITVEGKKFIPVPFTVEDGFENEKKYLSLYVCESFDQKTRKCKDYENRPEACRKFFCNGKPQPQRLDIVGRPKSSIVLPAGVKAN